jgi:hypothetical protein
MSLVSQPALRDECKFSFYLLVYTLKTQYDTSHIHLIYKMVGHQASLTTQHTIPHYADKEINPPNDTLTWPS